MPSTDTAPAAPPPRIDLAQDWNVDYWKTTLGVAREELIEAVRQVGDDARVVAEHLARKAASGPSS